MKSLRFGKLNLFVLFTFVANGAVEAGAKNALDEIKLEPVNRVQAGMERSVSGGEFDTSLCGSFIEFRQPMTDHWMEVSKRSLFSKPEDLKTFDRLTSVFNGGPIFIDVDDKERAIFCAGSSPGHLAEARKVVDFYRFRIAPTKP